MNISISKEFITENVHVVAGVITALIVPADLGIRVVAGTVVASAVKAVLIARKYSELSSSDENIDAYDDEQNMNAMSALPFIAAGTIMALPTIVNPVVSIVAKVIIFTVIRRMGYDFSMATYGKSPFARSSFTCTLTPANLARKSYTFTI